MHGGGGGGMRDFLVRCCAASCMLAVVAVTAALASLAASLYGQGKLSAHDAWQLVPPVLVPASVAPVLVSSRPPLALLLCSFFEHCSCVHSSCAHLFLSMPTKQKAC
jgi:hypothetical protein